jgi:hypothetical protein
MFDVIHICYNLMVVKKYVIARGWVGRAGYRVLNSLYKILFTYIESLLRDV